MNVKYFKDKAFVFWEKYKQRQRSDDYYFSPHVIIPSHIISGISMIWLLICEKLSDYYLIYEIYPQLIGINDFFKLLFFVSSTFIVVEYGRDWCIKWTKEVHEKKNPELVISAIYFSIYILFVSYSKYTDSSIGVLIGVTVIMLISFKKLYQLSEGVLFLRLADFMNWIVAILFFLLVSISILSKANLFDYIIFYIFSSSIILGAISYYDEKLEQPFTTVLSIIVEIAMNLILLIRSIIYFVNNKM